MKHRPELDGLRGVAVLPVILFHAGVPGFPGGYLGVDVFFVISGYLITSIILADLANSTFTFRRFYERRARRILPALLVVVLASMPFAWMWLGPEDLKAFSRSVVAVALFVSNILFWRESGYFDTAGELKPLLHTWSLSIEEQFYLLFPVTLLLLWKLGRRRLELALVVGLVLSLALAEYASRQSPSAGFYLLPTRGWELLAGAYLASRERARPFAVRPGFASMLALIGLLLIVISVASFGPQTRHPGLLSLLPVGGTALVIAYGQVGGLATRLLTNRLLVGAGLISYSLYLWHQPVFVFARHASMRDVSGPAAALLLGLSIGLAAITWKFVETPFRNRVQVRGPVLWTVAGTGSVALLLLGIGGYLRQGFPERAGLPPALLASFGRDSTLGSCFDIPYAHRKAEGWFCTVGEERTNPAPVFFVFGDSHAYSLLPVFRRASVESGSPGLFTGFSGCAPLLGTIPVRDDQIEKDCQALNARVFSHVKEQRIGVVFLVARWTYYTDGDYQGEGINLLRRAADQPVTKTASRGAFLEGLTETIRAYQEIGAKVIIVPQVPMQLYRPQDIYFRSYKAGAGNAEVQWSGIRRLSLDRSLHRSFQTFVRDAFANLDSPTVEVMPIDDLFCDASKCLVGAARESYYSDEDHLSRVGSLRLLTRLRERLPARIESAASRSAGPGTTPGSPGHPPK